MKPYWTDGTLALYLGDMREVLPALAMRFDCAVADPPYGETHYGWDKWPDGWPAVAGQHTASLWCFGSMRMFWREADEFAAWQMSQDCIWRKAAPDGGSQAVGFVKDRFRRAHELMLHFYSGRWADVYHVTPREKLPWSPGAGQVRSHGHGHDNGGNWWGTRNAGVWEDDGTRLRTSVIDGPRMWKRNIAPTQKPEIVLAPLIEYSCPPGGIVLDPFAGSGSTLATARAMGRRGVGIEGDERQLERTVLWLAQETMTFEVDLDDPPEAEMEEVQPALEMDVARVARTGTTHYDRHRPGHYKEDDWHEVGKPPPPRPDGEADW